MFGYDRFRIAADREPRSPMGEGGEGMWFVYLSNRNRCTFLFDACGVDSAFYDELSSIYEMGYSTLFVLEKWLTCRAGTSPPRPELPAAIAMAEGWNFCVFRDPERCRVGGSAIVSEHPDVHTAIDAAIAYPNAENVDALAARIAARMTWH